MKRLLLRTTYVIHSVHLVLFLFFFFLFNGIHALCALGRFVNSQFLVVVGYENHAAFLYSKRIHLFQTYSKIASCGKCFLFLAGSLHTGMPMLSSAKLGLK